VPRKARSAPIVGALRRHRGRDPDRGAEVVQEPARQPYGIRDCAVRDPTGNLIRLDELS
jgi:hypothetical protein